VLFSGTRLCLAPQPERKVILRFIDQLPKLCPISLRAAA